MMNVDKDIACVSEVEAKEIVVDVNNEACYWVNGDSWP